MQQTELIKPTRRGFLADLGCLLAAPAIVRASSLMPVRAMPVPTVAMPLMPGWEYDKDGKIIIRMVFRLNIKRNDDGTALLAAPA